MGKVPTFAEDVLNSSETNTIVVVVKPAKMSSLENSIEVTRVKENIDANVGLVFSSSVDDGAKHIRISSIDSTGLFSNSPLCVGDKVLSINTIQCTGKGEDFAKLIVENSPHRITFVIERFEKTLQKGVGNEEKKEDITPQDPQSIWRGKDFKRERPNTSNPAEFDEESGEELYQYTRTRDNNGEASFLNSVKQTSFEPIKEESLSLGDADLEMLPTRMQGTKIVQKDSKIRHADRDTQSRQSYLSNRSDYSNGIYSLNSHKSQMKPKKKKMCTKRLLFIVLLNMILIVVAISIIVVQKVNDASFENIFGLQPNEIMGSSISLSAKGDKMAVGGHSSARVYSRDISSSKNNPWTLEADLSKFVNGEYFSSFSKVELTSDGTALIVGDYDSNSNGLNSGQIMVFTRTDSKWRRIGKPINGEARDDLFGNTVSISNNSTRITVSADKGYVKTFDLIDSTWTMVKKFTFGTVASMSANGKMAAIGDYRANSASGQVFVYDLDTGILIDKLNGEKILLGFGFRVVFSGDGSTIAVGYQSDIKKENESIALVCTYRFDPASQKFKRLGLNIIGPPFSQFGSSMSLSDNGNILAIGAPRRDVRGENRGTAYVYDLKDDTWQRRNIISGKKSEDECGKSVAVSGDGNQVAIGSAKNDESGEDSGQVRTTKINQ